MKVLKRDKTVEEFQIKKIEKAIGAAFESCGETPKSDVLDCIKSIYNENDTLNITFDNSYTESEITECSDVKDIVLNDNYLYDVLKNMSSNTEKIKMYFNSPVSPMYILPDGETNFDNVDLILPIRL